MKSRSEVRWLSPCIKGPGECSDRTCCQMGMLAPYSFQKGICGQGGGRCQPFSLARAGRGSSWSVAGSCCSEGGCIRAGLSGLGDKAALTLLPSLSCGRGKMVRIRPGFWTPWYDLGQEA